MKKRTAFAALAVVAAAALVLPTSTVGAQDTGELFAFHGLNLDEQTNQDQRGSAVTVCLGTTPEDDPVLADFQFGDFESLGSLPVGTELNVVVFEGEVPCDEDAAPLLVQDYVVESGTTVLVATGVTDDSSGFPAQLTPYGVDVDCTEPGSGRLTAGHASANTPEVTLVSGGAPLGNLTFGSAVALDLPEDEYLANVLVDDEPVFPEELELPVVEGVNTFAFVVGDLPNEGPRTPVVAIGASLEVGVCDGPPTPDPDPEAGPQPDPEGDAGAPGAVPGAAAGERPLALTG